MKTGDKGTILSFNNPIFSLKYDNGTLYYYNFIGEF